MKKMELMVLELGEAEANNFINKLNFKPLSLPRKKYACKDNEIVFVTLGGRGDEPKERGFPPDFYGLFIDEYAVLFSVYSGISSQPDGERLIDLEISLLSEIRDGLIEEIKKTIKTVMESYYSTRGYVDFDFKILFPPSLKGASLREWDLPSI